MELKYSRKKLYFGALNIALIIIAIGDLITLIIGWNNYYIEDKISGIAIITICLAFAAFFRFGRRLFAKVTIDESYKTTGQKDEATIISTIDCDEEIGCLIFDYHGTIMYVCFVENNDCYKAIRELLKQNKEALSIKENYMEKMKVKIPVDVYKKGRRIFLDLSSIKLDEIDGLKELMKKEKE